MTLPVDVGSLLLWSFKLVHPEDDYQIQRKRIEYLNRMDDPEGCSAVVAETKDGPEYCELPEHDPFSHRCYEHAYGNWSYQ